MILFFSVRTVLECLNVKKCIKKKIVVQNNHELMTIEIHFLKTRHAVDICNNIQNYLKCVYYPIYNVNYVCLKCQLKFNGFGF